MKLTWHQFAKCQHGVDNYSWKITSWKNLACKFHLIFCDAQFLFSVSIFFLICWLKIPAILQELDLYLTRLSHASDESKFPMPLPFLNWGPASQHVYEHCELHCSLMVQIYVAVHELSQKKTSQQSITTSLLIWIIVRCHWSSSRVASVTISMV